ncbi:MAG: type VI secretion system baseplate subunit TssG [Desulfobacterales bacterium]|nr:type VI secretion system baseplate subunit TssG [Desulfobacterales bacterium]
MGAPKRSSNITIKERLFEEFFNFSFYKAVHLLETLAPGKRPLGQTPEPDREAVRFSVKPGILFPASDIAGLKETPGENAPTSMQIAFMGLIGPSGVLPYWYNELAQRRNLEKDFTLTSFFDLFHHRLISLFYLAWKKHRFPENYVPGANDRLSRYLLSLAGLGTPGLTRMIGLPEESIVFYSGLLARPMAAAVSIEATVAYLAGTRVFLDQFIDRLLPLEPEDRTRLGAANARLGEDAVCGSHVWESQTKFRVNLGPMTLVEFLRFIPSGDMIRPIFALVRYMVGAEFEFEIRIYLKREEVPPCILGDSSPAGPKLGWTTWLSAPGATFSRNPNLTFQEKDIRSRKSV